MAEKETTTAASEESKVSADVGLVEKAFLMGIGAAMYAKNKAEELADELVQRGKMSQEDSESFAGRLASRMDETAHTAQKTVADETSKVARTVGLASKNDIARLQDELTEIKSLLASMKPTEGGTSKP